jgi:Tol biopolymer transport system component
VDFSPLRLFSIPGSGGLGEIISVTNSLSGDLLVAAAYGQGLCGAYAIDTSHGTRRPIWTEPERSNCGFFVTQVEPDSKRVLISDNLNFRVVNVLAGAIELSGVGHGAWSPDGNWLAISAKGEVTFYDGRTFSVRRRFRASSVDGHLVWSPDSKRILFAQQELRCFPMRSDFESLAVLDVEAGKTRVISSSHCMVTNSQIGWIDMGVLSASTGIK